MATYNIIIQGAGGHARVIIDCAKAQGYQIVRLYDPNCTGELYGIPIHNIYYKDEYRDAKMIIAIGENAVREKIAHEAKHSFANIIHSSAVLSPYAKIGLGNAILQGVIVQAESRIGNHVILNTRSQVDHDCIVEDFVHLAPGVILCGNVHIGKGSFIGAGSIVIPGKRVGSWSIVGAGSVVIDDIPDNVVAVGNPARVIKLRPAL